MNKQKISPWLIAFRVIFTIALIVCIGYIFHNSLEEGVLSAQRSQQVTQAINSALDRVHIEPVSERTVRKLAHFLEYTLLGFLLMMCLRVYTAHFVRHTSWPLLGGMTTALADETLQLYVSGRSSQVTDVWIDMGGVTAGLFVALLLLLLLRLIMAFYRVNRENKRLREQNAAYEREQRSRVHAELAHRAVQRARQNRPEQEESDNDRA